MIIPAQWKLVVLESPYAATTSEGIAFNIAYARRCVRDCLTRGESAQASHLLFTQEGILRDSISEERRCGISAGLAWRRVADYSVFYTDQGWSPGMLDAIWQLVNRGATGKFRIRALDRPPILPAALDEEISKMLDAHIECL